MARIDVPWFLREYRKHESGIRAKNKKYYWWIPLDRPIVGACESHPTHSDYCEVYAKVALVNRMYSAQLGRGRSGKYEAEDRMAHALCKSDIDKFLGPLLGLHALCDAVLPKVVKCHDRMVAIGRRAIGTDALSFSSKYLSFHAPRVVPILDSRAAWTAGRVLKGMSGFRGYGAYEKHCRRVLVLMHILAESKIEPDVKLIDYVLYSDTGV
jgi:hypothetical protein